MSSISSIVFEGGRTKARQAVDPGLWCLRRKVLVEDRNRDMTDEMR